MKNNITDTQIVITMLMTPDKANFTGENVHGGEIMKMLDHVAYVCAARYTGTYVVTLSVDKVMFKQPVKVGSLVTFDARINYTGKTSLEVEINVYSEDIRSKNKALTNTCYFTMVAVDDDGKPTPVPPLPLNTKEDKNRFEEAKKRKERRIALSEEV